MNTSHEITGPPDSPFPLTDEKHHGCIVIKYFVHSFGFTVKLHNGMHELVRTVRGQ